MGNKKRRLQRMSKLARRQLIMERKNLKNNSGDVGAENNNSTNGDANDLEVITVIKTSNGLENGKSGGNRWIFTRVVQSFMTSIT